jgi:hypothetical protein
MNKEDIAKRAGLSLLEFALSFTCSVDQPSCLHYVSFKFKTTSAISLGTSSTLGHLLALLLLERKFASQGHID